MSAKDHPAKRATWGFLVVAAWAVFLCFPACSSHYEGQLAEARQALVGGRYLEGQDRFAALYEAYPDDPQVVYGYARILHVLHQYEQAWLLYERAVALNPGDGQVVEHYLKALAWGGLLRKDRQVLETALEVGRAALERFPNRPAIYDDFAKALSELGRSATYAETLAALQAQGLTSPVLDVERYKARLQAAREDSLETKRLKTELRASLRPEENTTSSLAGLYRQAVGHLLLDEKTRADTLLTRLEQTETGRRMATPLRWTHFFFDDIIAANRSGNPEARVGVTQSWEARFAPAWNTGNNRYRVLLRTRFDALTALARMQDQDTTAAPISPARLDSLVRLGQRLVHLDTWGGAGYYLSVSRLLVDLEDSLEEAVRLTDKGIADLETDRPGLIYPGAEGDARVRSQTRLIAQLKGIQGEALAKLGRDSQAEPLLRAAAEENPTARSYGILGESLIKQNRHDEGVDALLTALSYGFDDQDFALETRAQAMLEEAVREDRFFSSTLSEALRQRQHMLQEQRRDHLVANRLDQEITDFELEDRAGHPWRLADLKGNVVALNYWSMWCGYCEAQFPHYQHLVDEYQNDNDITFLAINIDDNPESVRRWLEEHGYTFKVLFDEGTSVDNKVLGTPTTLIIGPRGHLQYRSVGFSNAEAYLEAMRLRIEALRPATSGS